MTRIFVIVRIARAEGIHARRAIAFVRLTTPAGIAARVVPAHIALVAILRTVVVTYPVPVATVVRLVERQSTAVAAPARPRARGIRPRRLARIRIAVLARPVTRTALLVPVVVARARYQALAGFDRVAALLRSVIHTDVTRTGLPIVAAVGRAFTRRAVTTRAHIAVRAVVAVVTNRATRLTRHTAHRAIPGTVAHLAARIRTLAHTLRAASTHVVPLVIRPVAVVVRAIALLRRVRMNRAVVIVAIALLRRVILARRGAQAARIVGLAVPVVIVIAVVDRAALRTLLVDRAVTIVVEVR